MELEFTGAIVFWRGPAPFHFVRVPDDESDDIHEIATEVTYGWGVIPATVHLGDTTWTTSLFPKDGGYLVPIKAAVRTAEGVEVDDEVRLRVSIA